MSGIQGPFSPQNYTSLPANTQPYGPQATWGNHHLCQVMADTNMLLRFIQMPQPYPMHPVSTFPCQQWPATMYIQQPAVQYPPQYPPINQRPVAPYQAYNYCPPCPPSRSLPPAQSLYSRPVSVSHYPAVKIPPVQQQLSQPGGGKSHHPVAKIPSAQQQLSQPREGRSQQPAVKQTMGLYPDLSGLMGETSTKTGAVPDQAKAKPQDISVSTKLDTQEVSSQQRPSQPPVTYSKQASEQTLSTQTESSPAVPDVSETSNVKVPVPPPPPPPPPIANGQTVTTTQQQPIPVPTAKKAEAQAIPKPPPPPPVPGEVATGEVQQPLAQQAGTVPPPPPPPPIGGLQSFLTERQQKRAGGDSASIDKTPEQPKSAAPDKGANRGEQSGLLFSANDLIAGKSRLKKAPTEQQQTRKPQQSRVGQHGVSPEQLKKALAGGLKRVLPKAKSIETDTPQSGAQATSGKNWQDGRVRSKSVDHPPLKHVSADKFLASTYEKMQTRRSAIEEIQARRSAIEGSDDAVDDQEWDE